MKRCPPSLWRSLALGLALGLLGGPLGAAGEDAGAASAASADSATAAIYAKGLALEKAGQYEAAADDYREALDADPTFTLAMRELGRCELKLGWKEGALAQLQAFQDAGGDDDQVDKMVEFLQDQGDRLGTLPVADQGAFGLGLDLGYAWGFTSQSFGRDYNASNNADQMTYTLAPGEGLSAGLEAYYRLSPALSVGLEARPLSADVVGASTLTDGLPGALTVTADSTEARLFALPMLLKVRTSAQLGPRVSVGCVAGVGVAFAQPYVETSTQHLTDADGHFTTVSRYQKDLQDGMAFEGGVGAQVKISAHLSFFINATLLLAGLPATAAEFQSSTFDDATGKTVATSAYSASYISAPPPVLTGATPASTSTLNGSVRTTVTTYDDGQEQYTLTRETSGGAVLNQSFTESQLLSSVTGADEVSYKLLATSLGLRWEF